MSHPFLWRERNPLPPSRHRFLPPPLPPSLPLREGGVGRGRGQERRGGGTCASESAGGPAHPSRQGGGGPAHPSRQGGGGPAHPSRQGAPRSAWPRPACDPPPPPPPPPQGLLRDHVAAISRSRRLCAKRTSAAVTVTARLDPTTAPPPPPLRHDDTTARGPILLAAVVMPSASSPLPPHRRQRSGLGRAPLPPSSSPPSPTPISPHHQHDHTNQHRHQNPHSHPLPPPPPPQWRRNNIVIVIVIIIFIIFIIASPSSSQRVTLRAWLRGRRLSAISRSIHSASSAGKLARSAAGHAAAEWNSTCPPPPARRHARSRKVGSGADGGAAGTEAACTRSWDVAGRPFSLAKINALQTEIVSRDSRVPRPSRRALHRTSVCLLRLRRCASNRTRSWWRARGR